MSVLSAHFVQSSPAWDKGPEADRPEVGIIGRSNVGKSSLLNRLVGHHGLAKVSATPGKTRLLNYFAVNEPQPWYLVDLPGYGYAKRSKDERAGYEKLIWGFLLQRLTLFTLLLLVDLRHEPQELDIAMISKLAEAGVPFTLVFTKADKLSSAQRKRQLEEYETFLLKDWDELPPRFVTSAESGLGVEGLRDYLFEVLSSTALEGK